MNSYNEGQDVSDSSLTGNDNNSILNSAPPPRRATTGKRKKRSPIWEYFNDVEDQLKLAFGTCMHCDTDVSIYCKSENALSHLVNCKKFIHIIIRCPPPRTYIMLQCT